MNHDTQLAHEFLFSFLAGKRRASLDQLNEVIHTLLQNRLDEKLIPAIRSAAKYVPMSAESLDRRIYRKFVQDHGLNAETKVVSSGQQYEIVVYLGLPSFFMLLGKFICRGAGVMDSEDGSVIEEASEFSDLMINDIVSFLSDYSGEGGLINAFTLAENLNGPEKQMANFFSHFSELFVLGHELGHVISDISDDLFPRSSFDEVTMHAIREAEIPQDWNLEQVSRNWSREFQADRIGLKIIQEQFDQMVRIANCLNGAAVFFLGCSLADFALHGNSNRVTKSHPPCLARLSALMGYCEPLSVRQRGFVLGLRDRVCSILKEMGSVKELPPLIAGSIPTHSELFGSE